MKAPCTDIKEMFHARVSMRNPTSDGCWIWVGAKHVQFGYGVLKFGGRAGKLLLAHRVSYEIYMGPIPDGCCVLHKCDNPPCVNPEHLFLGTRADNSADKVSKGRQSFTPGQKGAESPNAKLTDADVLHIRSVYSPRTVSADSLAREFGVSKRAILRIIHRVTWNHI